MLTGAGAQAGRPAETAATVGWSGRLPTRRSTRWQRSASACTSARRPGSAGGGSSRHGAAGADLEVPVPPGTIVRRRDAAEGEAPLAELVAPGERALLALGGRGGRGNASFKTGRNKCVIMSGPLVQPA